MNLFTKLTFDGSGIEEMILERESNIGKSELLAYIDQYKDISYSIGDKKKARYIYCNVCDTVKHHALFGSDSFSYAICPYCIHCAQFSSKVRSDMRKKIEKKKREQRKKSLLVLKKEKLSEEKRRKEEKQRQILNNDKLYRAEQELYQYEYFHEHGVYPTKKNTDNNVIYMWKHDDMYKIGITSKRRGTKRIYDVAKEGNMHNVEILIYEEVNDALAVESALLQYGTKVKFNHIFDGCTEFRYLNDEERYCVEDIVREYAVNQ